MNRVRFLLDALADLDASLRKVNSRLLVLQGTPQEVLPRLFTQVRACDPSSAPHRPAAGSGRSR